MSTLLKAVERERDKRDAQIRRLLATGKTKKEIAKALGITRQRLYVILLRVGKGNGK